MVLIFDTNNVFIMAASEVPASHTGDDYKKAILPEGTTFESNYTYTYEDGAAVKGSLIPVDLEEEARMEAEYLATKYRDERRYPSIGDQLDALFHAGAFPADMAAQIQATKDAHPKPTGE